MPGSAAAEVYFIAAMMVLIFAISFASVFFFFRQYKKEMKQRANEKALKQNKVLDETDSTGIDD